MLLTNDVVVCCGYVFFSYEASKLDMASPQRVGLLSSLSNTFASVAGVVGVPLASAVVNVYDGEWSYVFLLIAVTFVVGWATFVCVGSAKRVL